MSPYRAKARLLGIGVADIARTCGVICILPFWVSPKAAEPVPDADAQLNCKFCQYNQIINVAQYAKNKEMCTESLCVLMTTKCHSLDNSHLSEEIIVFTATLFFKNAAQLYNFCKRMVGDPASFIKK